jgi:hypothetical protein
MLSFKIADRIFGALATKSGLELRPGQGAEDDPFPLERLREVADFSCRYLHLATQDLQ